MRPGHGSSSMLNREGMQMPRTPPADWPSGKQGVLLWNTLVRHRQGVSYSEMAREEGVDPGRIRTRCYTARTELVRRGLL